MNVACFGARLSLCQHWVNSYLPGRFSYEFLSNLPGSSSVIPAVNLFLRLPLDKVDSMAS